MGGTLTDALWGGGITVVLSVIGIPIAPLFGGAAAADRHGGGRITRLWLGFLAGIVSTVPVYALSLFWLYIFVVRLGNGISRPVLIPISILGILTVYNVGLSAVGGLLSVWAKKHNRFN
jgi:ABC-type amino acid transport system permease subunit